MTRREGFDPPTVRVMIADDSDRTRAGLRALLATVPGAAVVAEACHGAQAVHLAEAEQPDVVLMDVRMPVMDGVTATQRIKSRWPSVRVIVLTVCAAFQERAIAAGADAFLVKGCANDDLVAAITAANASPGDDARQRPVGQAPPAEGHAVPCRRPSPPDAGGSGSSGGAGAPSSGLVPSPIAAPKSAA